MLRPLSRFTSSLAGILRLVTYTTPAPTTVSNGDTFQASSYNIIAADIQDHESRVLTLEDAPSLYGCGLVASGGAPSTIGTAGAYINATWAYEVYDSKNMFTVSDPTKITIVRAGVYSFVFNSVLIASSGTPTKGDQFEVFLKRNGSSVRRVTFSSTSSSASNSIYTPIVFSAKCSVGDYMQINIGVVSSSASWGLNGGSGTSDNPSATSLNVQLIGT